MWGAGDVPVSFHGEYLHMNDFGCRFGCFDWHQGTFLFFLALRVFGNIGLEGTEGLLGTLCDFNIENVMFFLNYESEAFGF